MGIHCVTVFQHLSHCTPPPPPPPPPNLPPSASSLSDLLATLLLFLLLAALSPSRNATLQTTTTPEDPSCALLSYTLHIQRRPTPPGPYSLRSRLHPLALLGRHTRVGTLETGQPTSATQHAHAGPLGRALLLLQRRALDPRLRQRKRHHDVSCQPHPRARSSRRHASRPSRPL